MTKIRAEHVAAAGIAAVVALVWLANGKPGLSKLAFTENDPSSRKTFPGTPAQPARVYTPHAYPARVGVEVTTAISRGITSGSLPARAGMGWLADPPSEVIL